MARDENSIPLDELFAEKTRSFETGRDEDYDWDSDERAYEADDHADA